MAQIEGTGGGGGAGAALNGVQRFLANVGWYFGTGVNTVVAGKADDVVVDAVDRAVQNVKAKVQDAAIGGAGKWFLLGGGVLLIILIFRR